MGGGGVEQEVRGIFGLSKKGALGRSPIVILLSPSDHIRESRLNGH